MHKTIIKNRDIPIVETSCIMRKIETLVICKVEVIFLSPHPLNDFSCLSVDFGTAMFFGRS